MIFYVHDFSIWHVSEEAQKPALCGKTPQREGMGRMKFREYDPRLEADARTVCRVCLMLLPESVTAQGGTDKNGGGE